MNKLIIFYLTSNNPSLGNITLSITCLKFISPTGSSFVGLRWSQTFDHDCLYENQTLNPSRMTNIVSFVQNNRHNVYMTFDQRPNIFNNNDGHPLFTAHVIKPLWKEYLSTLFAISQAFVNLFKFFVTKARKLVFVLITDAVNRTCVKFEGLDLRLIQQ